MQFEESHTLPVNSNVKMTGAHACGLKKKAVLSSGCLPPLAIVMNCSLWYFHM